MSLKPYVRILLFFLLGFVIYFIDITMNSEEDTKDIYVSDQELDGLFAAWKSQVGRPPNEQEIFNIVNDFVEEEILYREALRLGLDQNDRIIKRRLAQKISFLKQETNKEDPTTEQLIAFYKTNKDRYVVPPTFSFTHHYFSKSPKARENALRALENIEGTPANLVAEPFFLGKNFSEYSLGEIKQAFGPEILPAFDNPELKQWIGPYPSSFGEHLLYINNKTQGYFPEFQAIEALLKQDLLIEKQDQRLTDYIDSVKTEYKVIINPNYKL
ncbi:MAG: rotamase [Gammaproteobacteria bacterium]|nr:rotamase [Gammaproteobacteria bacterium]